MMETMMKLRSSTLLVLAGSTLIPGCAFFDSPSEPVAEAPARIVPFARVRDSQGSAEAWYTLGRHMQRSGRLDEAANAYRRAIDVDPDYMEAKNGLAAVTAGKGDIDQAIAILEELSDRRPGQAHVLANLGYARALKGQYRDARIVLEQAVALDPDNASIRAKLDAVLAALGEAPDKAPHHGPDHAPTPSEVPVTVALADGRSHEVIVPLSPGIYELRQQGVIAVPAPVLEEVRVIVASEGSGTKGAAGTTGMAGTASSAAAAPAAASAVVVAAGVGKPESGGSAGSEPALQRIDERVEIVNGNGVTGLARSLRALIGSDWKVIRVLNHDSYTVRATRIEYAKRHYAAARQLAGELGVDAQLRPMADPGDIHLRVVLGHDYRSLEALRSRLTMAIAFATD